MSKNFLLEAGAIFEVFKRQQRDSNPQPLSLYRNTQPFSQTGQFGKIIECSFTNKVVVGSNPVAVTLKGYSAGIIAWNI